MAPWQALYPFESRFLSLGGEQYHYLDEGTGAPLLLVHGNPTWSFYWRNLIADWRKDYRVLAVDHIGCGRSSKPQNYPYTLQHHAENLLEFIRQIGLRDITLMGHDWGGAIGMLAATMEPNLFSRLVMCNTAAFGFRKIPWRIGVFRIPYLGAFLARRLNAFARGAITSAVIHRERITPAVRQGLLAPYDSWRNRIAIHRFIQDIPDDPSHPTYKVIGQLEQGLNRLAHLPLLLVWGMKDWCFNHVALRKFQKFFPGAETHQIDDAGHYVVEDAHERIIPVVRDFIKRHAVAGAASSADTDRIQA